MFLWIAENIGTVFAGLVVAGAVAVVIVKIVRGGRKGKCAGCCGGCLCVEK